jgi:voltage-gated potassium channel
MSFLKMRTLAYASFLFVFGVALIMYLAEPDTFGTYFRAVYWTMTAEARQIWRLHRLLELP